MSSGMRDSYGGRMFDSVKGHGPSEAVAWDVDRERRIRKALSILGPTSPRFTRDDMRAALDEIDGLRALISEMLADRYEYKPGVPFQYPEGHVAIRARAAVSRSTEERDG